MTARALPLAARVGFALDRALAVLAPSYGLARSIARKEFVARMYLAAKPTGDAGGWLPYDGDANSLIRGSSQVVRSRARQLVRDFPYAQRAIKLRSALIIGKGIRMQARFKMPDGKMHREANAAIEKAFAEWAEKADITGRLSFADLQILADRQDFECGEYFFIKRYLRGEKHPLRLQPVEPDRLPYGVGSGKVDAGNELMDGIEFHKATGRPLFYHFQDDGFRAKTLRVPADLVIHGYEVERPGQMRGICPIASAIMVAGNLADLLDAELDATRIASRLVAFIRSNDIPGFHKGAVRQEDNEGKKPKRPVELFDHATIQYLREGDEIQMTKLDRQSGTFEPFLKFNIRTFAVGAGLTYELVSGDYDKISYSNLRGIRLDLAMIIEPVQSSRINKLCRPVSAAWLEAALLTDPSLMPYARTLTPSSYSWIPPGMDSPDPLKEVKAQADEIKLGTNSPQRICTKRGLVFSEILDELAEAKAMMEERGLTPQEVSTALKNNPAALMGEDKEK